MVSEQQKAETYILINGRKKLVESVTDSGFVLVKTPAKCGVPANAALHEKAGGKHRMIQVHLPEGLQPSGAVTPYVRRLPTNRKARK